MSSERDTIVDFIDWLEDVKGITLIDAYLNFVVPWDSINSYNTCRLDDLIEEWGNDIETNL